MKKLLVFLMLLCTVFTGAWADDWTVNIPDGTVSVSSSKANSVVAATSADDNAHWYVMQQDRDGLTPVVAPSVTDGAINRESNALSSYITNGVTSTTNAKKYLVRLVPSGTNNVYYIQFGTGLYFGHTAATLTLNSGSGTALNGRTYANADKYFVYNIASSDTHIGVSYTANNSAHTARLDNNGKGNGLSYWTSGQKSTTGGNDDWSFYAVEFDFTAQTAQLTYKYTNGGQTWFTANAQEVIVGQPYPDLALPYGVTGTKPAGNVPSGDATVEIPVTYTKGTRGFDFSDDYEHAKWHKWYKRYSWQNTVRSELFYVESANYINQNKDNTNNTTDEYLWAAVGNPFDFVIINRAAGSGKYLSNPNNSVSDANEPYMQEQSEKTQHYYLYDCTDAGNTWGDMNFCIINAATHTTLSGNSHLNYWVNNNAWGDDGSRMIWEWVMNEQVDISVTFNYISNSGASWSTQKQIASGHTLVESDYAVDFYNNYSVSPSNLEVSESNNTFTISCRDNFPFEVGKLCRIQSLGTSGKNKDYYAGEKNGSWNAWVDFTYGGVTPPTMAVNSNLWYFSIVEGTPDIFTVRNYTNNKYITLSPTNGFTGLFDTPQGSVDNPSTTSSYFRLRKNANTTNPVTPEEGMFSLQHIGALGACVSLHNNAQQIGYWAGDNAESPSNGDNILRVLPIESFTTTLNAVPGDGFYGTIYLPFNMETSMAEVYAATASEGIMQLHKVEGVAPAGAYILYIPYAACTADEKETELITASSETPTTVEHNDLTGSIIVGETLPADGYNYVLGKKDKMGFYKYTVGTYPTTKAVYCSHQSGISGFTFEFEEDPLVSAIEQLKKEHMAGATIYDLQGRRMQNAVKGLNIVNGKKVIK